MAQHPVTTCHNCGERVDEADLACTKCGTDLEPVAAAASLETPDIMIDPDKRPRWSDGETAPASEFAAAGSLLLGFLLLILGAVIASGIVILVGVALMFGVTGFFAIYSGAIGRSWRAGLSNFGIGRSDDDRR
jgi:uncharacterized membrane protein YvbJ